MSVLTALYRTYCNALDNNMVDRTEQLQQQTVLLPVYHSNKKSSGANDMIEVTVSERGSFIKAERVPKDQMIIFPVTENSIIRAGSVIAPHPLCDELSYLSKELDPEKHKEYEAVRGDWVAWVKEGHNNRFLETLDEYLRQGTIFRDCIASLFSEMHYEVVKDYAVVVNPGEKAEKTIHLDKTFVTFRIETGSSVEADTSVSNSQEIHQNYINYVRMKNSGQPMERCDISGEMTYCVSRHRGLMGNAKLISISNHDETYYGRFDVGEQIVHIGYETSQKIHLMLKYLMENSQNKRKIGDSCVLVNWFSDDIGNQESVNVTGTIAPYGTPVEEERDNKERENNREQEDEEQEDEVPRTLGGGVSKTINDYITGINKKVNPEGKFYLMILDKISNGRISVKYFRELPKSDLFERVEFWYQTTSWPFFNSTTKKMIPETPSLFRYADTIFGQENEKGYVECRNSKLRTKTIERLLSCILEHRIFPRDMRNRMLYNLCNRSTYEKSWNYTLSLGCSIFKKYKVNDQKYKGKDQKKEEVSEMLDDNEQTRSYRYGRLLAVYEKLERDVLDTRASDSKERRATNAERLWSAYTKMPDRTLEILEEKVKPYRENLVKINYKSVNYYDSIITDVMCKLREATDYEQWKNRAIDEDFIFGYYAQRQEFYKKKENKQENRETKQEEGGSK